jgi:outer membrane protein TolC
MKRLALLLLPFLSSGQEATPRLSLEEAVRIAREGNTGILRARSQSAQAQADLSVANAGLWPSVWALSDFARIGPNWAGDPRDPHVNPAVKSLNDDQWTTTLSARWVLFDGLATTANRASRKGLAQAAKQREIGQDLSVPAQVAIAYHEVSRQQILLEAAARELDVSSERLSIARSRLEVGTVSALDEQQAELDDDADSSALLRQNLSLSQSRRQLNWLLARDPETPFQVDDSIPLLPLPPKADLLREAREHSPTLAETKAKEAAAEADDRGSSAAFLPTFSLYTNYSFLDQLRDDHPPANGYWQALQYGVQLSVPVFDGGSSLARAHGLSEALRQARINVREVDLALARDLAQAYAAAEQALVNQALESRNALLADNTLNLALGQFQAGAISGIDLRRVQEANLQAKSRAVSARTDASTTQILLFLLAGRPSS